MDRFIFHNLNNIHVHASNIIFQHVFAVYCMRMGFIKVADVIFFGHKAVREYNINCFFFHLKYCAHFNSHITHRKHVLHFFLIYIIQYLFNNSLSISLHFCADTLHRMRTGPWSYSLSNERQQMFVRELYFIVKQAISR